MGRYQMANGNTNLGLVYNFSVKTTCNGGNGSKHVKPTYQAKDSRKKKIQVLTGL